MEREGDLPRRRITTEAYLKKSIESKLLGKEEDGEKADERSRKPRVAELYSREAQTLFLIFSLAMIALNIY